MAREIIRVGDFKGDHAHADDMYEGGLKINRMTADIYARLSHTISAGEERFSSGLTAEARADLAVAQALVELAFYVEMPSFMLPFDITLMNQANLAAFHALGGRMTREGGDPTIYDWLAYGAYPLTVTDSLASIQMAVNASADRGFSYGPAGNYYVSGAIDYPAGKRTRILGDGRRVTNIKPLSGSVGKMVQLVHSHVTGEWNSSLAGVTLDGNLVATGPLLYQERTSLLQLDDVEVRQAAGIHWKLLSAFDSTARNVFLSNPTGAASPLVMDALVSAGEECDANRFFGLHIEGDTGAFPLVDIIGNATANVRSSHFYYLKAHGNPSNGNPNGVPVIRLAAGTARNKFIGGQVSYGRLAPQIEDAGQRNSFSDLEHVVRDANPPTFAVSVLATAVNHNTKNHFSVSTAYSSGIYSVATGAARTRIHASNHRHDMGTVIVNNAATQTDYEQPNARFTLIDGANIAVNPTLGQHADVLLGGSRTFDPPTNAVDGMVLNFTPLNNTGGAITTTWSTAAGGYMLAGAYVDGAAGKRRPISFRYFGYLTKWVEISRASADV